MSIDAATVDAVVAKVETHPHDQPKVKPEKQTLTEASARVKQTRANMAEYGKLVSKAAARGSLPTEDLKRLGQLCTTQQIVADKLRADIERAAAPRRTNLSMRRGF